MEKQLYFIENQGCDATTYGLKELTYDEFIFICKFIADLNKNSHYGCMPIIHIYEASWEDFKEVTTEDLKQEDIWEDNYIDLDRRYWINEKCYTSKEKYFYPYNKYKEIKVKEVTNVN